MFPRRVVVAATLVLAVLLPMPARAHCDSLDGPVVKAAQRALETGDVNRALVWVSAFDEAEVRAAFDKVRTVRPLGGTAAELANQFFFETLVRLHRLSEGEPYTGLKPAGSDPGPLVPVADQAIREMSAKPLVDLLTREVARGVRWHFDAVMAARIFPGASLEDGRRYVGAYLELMQYLEQLEAALLVPDEYSFLLENTTPE